MRHLFDNVGRPSVAKSVLLPEVERMTKAVSGLASLLMNEAVSLEDISKHTGLSLTELRYDGWENLFMYLRTLESDLKKRQAEIQMQDNKMRDLVVFVEETSKNLVKLYREGNLRNVND
jgi:regulator of replication initiation timing